MDVQTYNPSTWESEVAWATQQTQRRKTRRDGKRHLFKMPTSFPQSPRLCKGLDWVVCGFLFLLSPQDKVSLHSPSYPPTCDPLSAFRALGVLDKSGPHLILTTQRMGPAQEAIFTLKVMIKFPEEPATATLWLSEY